jgi:hypothetical protein
MLFENSKILKVQKYMKIFEIPKEFTPVKKIFSKG